MKQETEMEKLKEQTLEEVSGGRKQKYISSFYCEKCKATVHLNGVYTPETARKTHDRKVHPAAK